MRGSISPIFPAAGPQGVRDASDMKGLPATLIQVGAAETLPADSQLCTTASAHCLQCTAQEPTAMLRVILIAFAFTACIANTVPASTTPVAQSPVSNARVELASGACNAVGSSIPPWGPQRRCRHLRGLLRRLENLWWLWWRVWLSPDEAIGPATATKLALASGGG